MTSSPLQANPSLGPGKTLTIREIKTTPLIVPLDREYRGSFYGMKNRATILTQIVTEEGVVGEAYAGDEDTTLADIERIIHREIEPRLLGENAMAYERCWQLGFPVTYDQLRDKRVGLVALASVDLAIWDAIGKALDTPLWQLWGGYRSSVPVNIIGGYNGDDAGVVRDEVLQWLEMGFRGCKFKVGGERPPVEDAARIAAARDVAGPDFVITIDANQGYALPAALELCERVADLNIRWFEEPCVWANDHRDMREVRARGGIPVCAGQSEYSPEACRDLMDHGAIDVCNFDASWSGGYTNWRRMAAVAHLYSVQLGHHEEPQIALHLLGSQPHGTYVEVFAPDRDPVWWNILRNRPEVIDGHLHLTSAPGFGWDIDTEFVERYRVSS